MLWEAGGKTHTAGVAGLEDVQGASHVAFAEADEASGGFLLDFDVFVFDDVVDELSYIGFFQGAETESCASREKGRGELVGVVGNDAEAGVGGVFFHDPSESHLGS